jgi:hypothetical protein
VPVLEDRLHVVVPGHDPVADPLVVHDRLLGPQSCIGRKRVVLGERFIAVMGGATRWGTDRRFQGLGHEVLPESATST